MTTNGVPAASVILLRDAPVGAAQVLLLRRHESSGVLAGAFVFPGGKVDDADTVAPAELPPGEAERFVGSTAPEVRAAFVAALRELEEEAGVRLTPRDLVAFAHWITPSAAPRRFDTRFFVGALPRGQEPRVDGREMVALLWVAPADALARHSAGTLELPPPTQRLLAELAGCASAREAIARAASRTIAPIQPRVVPGEPPRLYLPHDPSYADAPGEGRPLPAGHPLAAGSSRFVLRDGRWHAE